MKTRMRLILMTFSLGAIAPDGWTQSFAVMTFNIRLDTPQDGENRWHFRKDAVAGLIKKYNPAFFGIQEGLYQQVMFLDSVLVDYDYIGNGRDDGKRQGEFTAIFYDETRFKWELGRTFFLSSTPGVPSLGWDAQYKRTCTYSLFTNKKSQEKLWVFNTHFDHVGAEARRQSAMLILQMIDEVTSNAPWPVILLGDLNATADEEPIRLLNARMQDAMRVSPGRVPEPDGTFNGFEADPKLDRRLDYIFVNGLTVKQYRHLRNRTKTRKWISDHFPVLARLKVTRRI